MQEKVKCLICETVSLVLPEYATLRLFTEQPWLNHLELACANPECVVTLRLFGSFETLCEYEEAGFEVAMQEKASERLVRLYRQAYGLQPLEPELTSHQEKQVKFLAWELEHMADELLDGGSPDG